MPSNLDKYRTDLARLNDRGGHMLAGLTVRSLKETASLDDETREELQKLKGSFEEGYQDWYGEAIAVIRQLTPDRLNEFFELYKGDGKRKNVHSLTFTIQDWLMGVRSAQDPFSKRKVFDDLAVVAMRFQTQLQILKASGRRLESSLFEIKQLAQADLFDSELDAARELTKKGFFRAAGAVVGVVLEKHLGQVAVNHSVVTRKKNPSIGDINDALKSADVTDVPVWRQIQRLADLRNLCDHSKEREPSREEIDELIVGAERLTKSLF